MNVGADAAGQPQKFTIMPDGTNKRQLTQTGGGNFYPAWSHNGKKIAFTTARAGAPELWVMKADASDQRKLLPFSYGAGRLPWQPAQDAGLSHSQP